MTRIHPGAPTQPLAPGAPLDREIRDLPTIQLDDVTDELTRAEIELLYAIAKHRKAWTKLRMRADERDQIEMRGTAGALPFLESDAIWKHRVSDVKWWAAEMNAQAAAVVALQQIKDRLTPVPRETVPAWVADTDLGSQDASVRAIVLGWNPECEPTRRQYEAVMTWMEMSRGKPHVSHVDRAKIDELIRRYRKAHPELYRS